MANTLFVPASKVVSNITNAVAAVVTTTIPHDYITGEIIRMHIPSGYGMQPMNQQYAPIVVINDTNFSIAIDTTTYEPFMIPTPQLQYAQCTAIGSVNSLLEGAVHNSLNPFFT